MKKFYKKFINKVGIIFLMAIMIGVLNCGSAYAITVGQQLLQPEVGWTRYDDTYNNITYIGGWSQTGIIDSLYNKQQHNMIKSNDSQKAEICFNFTGSKIRIIARSLSGTYSNDDIKIVIDNKVTETFSQKLPNQEIMAQVVQYEKLDLEDKEHSVKIYTLQNGKTIALDAIDIDSNGELKPYNSNQAIGMSLNKTLTTLEIGNPETLIATITPDNATNKNVTWTSSDSTVATVDVTGKVTAIKAGTAIITATAQDGSNVSANCNVTVTEPTSITLNKVIGSINVGQMDILIATTTPSSVGITWTSSDNTVATVDANGVVTGVAVGTAIITATSTDSKTASCIVNVEANKVVLNIEPERNKIKKSETVTANLVIDNITNIAAEDIRIKYDAEKLQFVNFVEVDGIKLVKNDVKTGELRFILASKGKDNIADEKKILLKLNFKGIAVGEALVDVVKGRVSDGIEMEKDLTDENCGQATIIIEEMKDVNNSGEFTLLDLAIDARHLGKNPTTLPQYNTDVVENGTIDDEDLLEIGNQMLLNPNYKF